MLYIFCPKSLFFFTHDFFISVFLENALLQCNGGCISRCHLFYYHFQKRAKIDAVTMEAILSSERGSLTVCILRARNLVALDLNGRPFVWW